MQFNPRISEEEDDKIMKRLVSILFVALVVSLAVVSYAWAQEQEPITARVDVTATVAPDINNQIGLGFSTGWSGGTDPTGQTGWSETSDASTPWDMGMVAPASNAFTEKGTNNTSATCYFWVYKYQSNTWSGVETEVTGSVLTLKDFARFYPWTGSDISSEPIPGPLTGTLESKPIHPSFASTWSWPTKLEVNLSNQWQISAGEYQAKITNTWFYSDEQGSRGTNDDRDPIERYFKLTVDKALDNQVGLVFGATWQGGGINDTPTDNNFTIDDSNWKDGITAEFYGGLSNFRSNTVTYNRITIEPMKQAQDGVDTTTDLRNYIYQYFWTGSNFTEQGQKIYPQGGGDYVITSTLQQQSGLCTVPNKFVVNIPKEDVFKVGAGTYTTNVKSEWSFTNGTTFSPILGATKTPTVSVTVPEVYDGYTLPESGTFGDAVKPGVTATYGLTIEGYQNHNRQVTVSTAVTGNLKLESLTLKVGTASHIANGQLNEEARSWSGKFIFNEAGEKSVLPLTWEFTPDWTYAPGTYQMTITLSHAPTM